MLSMPVVTALPTARITTRTQSRTHEMSRLINAAVVDKSFRDLLLNNPTVALRRGYNGESFRLSHREERFVLTVRAKSLADFATRWVGMSPEL